MKTLLIVLTLLLTACGANQSNTNDTNATESEIVANCIEDRLDLYNDSNISIDQAVELAVDYCEVIGE